MKLVIRNKTVFWLITDLFPANKKVVTKEFILMILATGMTIVSYTAVIYQQADHVSQIKRATFTHNFESDFSQRMVGGKQNEDDDF
ncbi:MAG: hypothetical protein AAFO69_09280 [Bacteroidota bacterium]